MANHKRIKKSKRLDVSIEQVAFDKFEQDFLREKSKNTKLSKGEFLTIIIMGYGNAN